MSQPLDDDRHAPANATYRINITSMWSRDENADDDGRLRTTSALDMDKQMPTRAHERHGAINVKERNLNNKNMNVIATKWR